MTERGTVVLDASVGVKWFRDEAGSLTARSVYVRAAAGELVLVAPTHFVHEVLSVVQREMTWRAIPEGWSHIKASGIDLIPLTDEVIAEAANQCYLLGCSFYEALAPACAALLGATLASADQRAHGEFPGVLIVE